MITVWQLRNLLLHFPQEARIVIDIDDFNTLNPRDIEHLYSVDDPSEKEIVVIDADWGKTKIEGIKKEINWK